MRGNNWYESGMVVADNLSPQKAALLLTLALTKTTNSKTSSACSTNIDGGVEGDKYGWRRAFSCSTSRYPAGARAQREPRRMSGPKLWAVAHRLGFTRDRIPKLRKSGIANVPMARFARTSG